MVPVVLVVAPFFEEQLEQGRHLLNIAKDFLHLGHGGKYPVNAAHPVDESFDLLEIDAGCRRRSAACRTACCTAKRKAAPSNLRQA